MENHISEQELDKQEDLTSSRLELVTNSSISLDETRPENSLINLMNWAAEKIKVYENLAGNQNLIKINNSKITIDGGFLQFCEEKKVEVKCLFSDALSCWKTEQDNEHFLSSGIFKITCGNFWFYHCALFHKGSKNEDDVSFFIIVSKWFFEKYIKFRNEYSDWLKQRNKDMTEIAVIGGDSSYYTTDLTWDSIYLEDSVKDSVKTSVEGFLKNKDFFHKLKAPWKHSALFWGEPGCGKTLCLRVIMSVYTELKPVTIQPGHTEIDDVLIEAFEFAQEHAPSLLFFEDIQEMMKECNVRLFLQLLDGVKGIDGVFVVATGNDLRNLEQNISNRPGRFDKKIEFPIPNKEMTKAYLNKWFGELIDEKHINSIVASAVKNKFTYSHLQDIYFNSVFIAVQNNREAPNKSDIDRAIKDTVQNKKNADDGFISRSVVSRRSLLDYNGDDDEA